MEFTFVPFEDSLKPAWDGFVEGHTESWPGQDSAIIAFARSCGQRSLSHLAYDHRGRVAAVIPAFLSNQRQARLFNFRTLFTGWSLRGGPLLRADLSQRVRRRFMGVWTQWLIGMARRERVDRIRVSFPYVMGRQLSSEIYPCYPLREFGFREHPSLALLVDLASTPADLMAHFRSECRNKIYKAERAGAEVRPIEDRRTWLEMYPLNLSTFQGQPVPAYSREALALIWDGFIAKGLARAIGVYYRDEPVSVGAIVGTRYAHYTWVVFNRHPSPVAGANNLLVRHAMEWARDVGARYYELGSVDVGDPRQEAISTFKQSFNGTLHYGLDGILTLSEVKQASVDWLQAVARRARGRAPGARGRGVPPQPRSPG